MRFLSLAAKALSPSGDRSKPVVFWRKRDKPLTSFGFPVLARAVRYTLHGEPHARAAKSHWRNHVQQQAKANECP
jgi:hypothetical protein